MLAKNNVSQLNPHLFQSFDEYSTILSRKIILFTERKPNSPEIIFHQVKYKLGDPISVAVPGHIIRPDQGLRKILASCYERQDLLDLCEENDGILFLYTGYVSVPASETNLGFNDKTIVQLKFLVFPFSQSI